MKVRIIREPQGAAIGASLKNYRAGEVYDLPSTLAEYLVMEDFAIFEMRVGDRSQPPIAGERRIKS